MLVLAFGLVTEVAIPLEQGRPVGAGWASAWVRARLAHAESLADSEPERARMETEEILADLARRRERGDGSLDEPSLDRLAADVIAVRNRIIHVDEAGDGAAKEAFIRAVADGAVWSDWRWGVPASVTLAQAILESRWGAAAPGNNLFGMKGTGPAGSTVTKVVEYRDGERAHHTTHLRAYRDVAEAVRDHGRVLATARQYRRAQAATEDIRAYARALTGTYATDPHYAGKLLQLIRKRQLDRYDWKPPAG